MPDPVLEAAVQRVHDADLHDAAAEAKAAFHLRMRARGVQDLAVLRAFELVSRQTFVPHRYLDLASRDLALPIGCGQTLDEPWLVARMIEALKVERGHRVLEIGAGTGYTAAILAHLAAEVIALERYNSLASAAQARLAELGLDNAAVVWADGLDLPPQLEPFDRILVHGLLPELPPQLMVRLVATGILVCARPTADGQQIVQVMHGDVTDGEEAPVEVAICPCRMRPIEPGLAAAL
jgi:protein-L-isoaspartate(D-aspartate) O-methyltransferase